MQEISLRDISGITTKAPCGAALTRECHVRIEISDFVMRAFVHKAVLHCSVILTNVVPLKWYTIS